MIKNNDRKPLSNLIIYVFLGAAVGSVIGLVAYVKDWL
ncbi:hypothetical protein SAMN05880501_104187 [Ureibacillus xyleni]|uniref:Uncharacterized protein n=1 Tax=Ureibacillus xyleni TaxID=614648 RepID=A0A285SDX0_9BACL|nr:hypothetical protein SAMN05880501_104187 [Ureibacillus xyleni]